MLKLVEIYDNIVYTIYDKKNETNVLLNYIELINHYICKSI